MAAVLVGQFHSRDAEGRVYSVHEFENLEATGDQPVTTYKLAIGDRVKKTDDDNFELVQSGVILIRETEYVAPVVPVIPA